MAQKKPVAYPNLVDQIRSVVDAHAAIQEQTTTHVEEHRAKLEQKRQQLHVSHVAKQLIEGDMKS